MTYSRPTLLESLSVTDTTRRGLRGAEDPASLLDELQREGYDGPRTAILRADLWEFGWFALRGMIREGTITHVETGHPHRSMSPADRQVLHESSEQRELVVLDALEIAVPCFLDHLRAGRWRPERGASMATYFIGTCASGFWRAYDRWTRVRVHELMLLDNLRLEPPAGAGTSDEIRFVELRESLRPLFEAATFEERIICAGILRDLSHAEIGRDLGISARAVEGRLHRLRRRARGLADRGVIDAPLRGGSRRTASTAADHADSIATPTGIAA